VGGVLSEQKKRKKKKKKKMFATATWSKIRRASLSIQALWSVPERNIQLTHLYLHSSLSSHKIPLRRRITLPVGESIFFARIYKTATVFDC
jgi:hypothetical protein